MAVSLSVNPTHYSCTLNLFLVLVSVSVFSLFNICYARSSVEIFKLSTGAKVSYYSEADSMDLPTLDAYDFSMLAPTNLFPHPPKNSPSPSPNGPSPVSSPPSIGPSPHPSDPYGAHPGPSQLPLPPAGAPKHRSGPDYALWCVARPTVPESMIQRAMDYACGNGADCGSVRPNGPCFVPNSLVAHASYAFNSYWQRTKIAGGTCDFGGTAMLITEDPSYNGCQFIFI
ncbi:PLASMODESMATA CALLOSE-BINDING PROTEIN 3 [Bienertia sinuspersici]